MTTFDLQTWTPLVFLNLLFNAVKFTPAGGAISIFAGLEDGLAVFRVRDTGMGIAAEQLPHVFERFWQADSSAQRKFQGVGIGLALVRELVNAHGGSVEAESEPGQGATMIVRLPAGRPVEDAVPAPPPPNPRKEAPQEEEWLATLFRRAEVFPGAVVPREAVAEPAMPSRGGGRLPRLLIAADEPDMRRFLKSQLAGEYEVLEAVDGDQAASMAAQYLPDIVVCDMMMPEKDGMQVCTELRAKTSTRGLPFLMLTARADDMMKIQALAAGANDFLTKPFSVTEIRVRLKNLVESHELQRKLAWQNRKLEATLEQLQETEIQLVQSEKLTSLGRMSAGIIHEINNPLNYAKSSASFLLRRAESLPAETRDEFEDALKDINDGLTRVAGIVGDLRAFSHPTGGTGEAVDVHLAVNSALRFLAAQWKDQVLVENQVSPGFTVLANRNKLMQVFVNLIQNSLDALQDKQFGPGERPSITISAEDHGDLSVVRVRDNGPGIDLTSPN